ncbi:hypothetical protein BST97_08910 [Nonlabens spongiae]|uniref:histidine kinase n=1 Tax=Nonlabens spongiae TaxID=331648 RepID=A0A1W6MKH2_9FLAO|nr:ATP-binding protein [Nonlabens spongiae]ARN78108.1 hypothetical protein BST97_08910 [Nonlabens spongiae]
MQPKTLIKKYPEIQDLDKCEDEPIRYYPNVQSHGCLIVTDYNLKIVQVSDNIEDFIGENVNYLLDKVLKQVLDADIIQYIEKWLDGTIEDNSRIFTIHNKSRTLILHKSDLEVLITIEGNEYHIDPALFQVQLLTVFEKLYNAKDSQDLVDRAAKSVRKLLGFDRVMVYQFDSEWNGKVMAEDRDPKLETWLDLHFPATDIPATARKLFQEQGVRSLTDVKDPYAALTPTINPLTGGLTDLSQKNLRGSSSIHIEYLKNMKVGATLSSAIIHEGKLWGLIACHHYSKKFVGHQLRQSCKLFNQMFSSQISLKESKGSLSKVEKITKIRTTLLNYMSKDFNIVDGLTLNKKTALNLIPSTGFYVMLDEQTRRIGKCLKEKKLKKLAAELIERFPDRQIIELDFISRELPWMASHSKKVSGVLLCRFSKRTDEYAMWLREEKLNTINWGGDPSQGTLESTGEKRLSPRKSFEKFSKDVECTSDPWLVHEVAGVKALIDDVKNLIVTKFTEIKQLNRQLQSLNEELESFSYSVSHDLRGPLRGIDGFAQILMEDYNESLDDYGKDALKIIIKSADKMNSLMDDILGYSGLSKHDKIDEFINVNKLIEDVVQDSKLTDDYPQTELRVSPSLPQIFGDKVMIYQLFLNLLTNAYKYSSKSETPIVEIGVEQKGDQIIYFVKDNGIGFKPEYDKKIFGVFTRLVKDEYKGTGVGLAIAQRVVLRHEGDIWAESKLGKGATFKFYLDKEHHADWK